MTCCHAVRALRSTVPKPVPVAALTQRKRESIYLMRNFPLDAQKMVDQKSGIKMLKRCQQGVVIGSSLGWKFARSQGKHMHPEKVHMGLKPR